MDILLGKTDLLGPPVFWMSRLSMGIRPRLLQKNKVFIRWEFFPPFCERCLEVDRVVLRLEGLLRGAWRGAERQGLEESQQC